jgi:ATP-dependent Clp protease, protease subunit
MSLQDQYYRQWTRMQPQPDPGTPGAPGEPEEEEKEERAEMDTRMLYKRLEKYFFQTRAIHLWGVVDDKSAKDVVTKLLLLDADSSDEIKFFISSPGGSVTSGMVIYDTMKLIKSPVSTICMGLAASMGSILLSAGEKGRRFIYPHGEVMIHQPSLGGHIQGVSADMEIHAEQILRTKEMGARILADNTGQTIERIRKDFERDYWMDAEKSIEYGIVDQIMTKLS